MEILRKIRSLLHEQGMTIEGARRVLSGAPVAVLRSDPVPRPSHTSSEPAVSAATAAMLQDALRELRELRALLTMNNAEENR